MSAKDSAPTGAGSRKRSRFNFGGEDTIAAAAVVLDISASHPAEKKATAATAMPVAAQAQMPLKKAMASDSFGGALKNALAPSVADASGSAPRSVATPSQAASAAPMQPIAKARKVESPPKGNNASPGPPSSSPATFKSNDAKNPNLPLEGLVIAFTGELDQLTRVDAEEKCKAAGAKVMGSLSGNTTHLVLGSHLDDGRTVEETSKYRKYLELKSKGKKWPELLNEAQLIAMLPGTQVAAPAPMAERVERQQSKALSSSEARTNWVDEHAPRSFDQLIGNASIVKKLTEWLRDWDNVCIKGNKKPVPFRPGGGMPDNLNARAALVSGPPGIGKTTTCKLVAQLHGGYEVLEYNASDARGAKIINEMADGISGNTTISFGGGMGLKKDNVITKRAVIIMDEVDGMCGGDRGGNAALIKMIKKTRNPIICICNDQHSPKVRSLAFSCYDLKFQRPTKMSAAQRCMQIAQREGLQVEPNALESLAESCGSDMRMMLNQLQMMAKSPKFESGVRYMDMSEKLKEMSKDQAIMLSPFDAAKRLLNTSEASRMSMMDRLDMFFVDHSLVGLLVQENYLKAVEKKPDQMDALNRAAYSADLMTVGDIINERIRGNQEWNLLPDCGIVSAVFPAQVTNGFVAFPSFPQWLGKYSTMSKTRRLTNELHAHLKLTSTCRGKALLTSGYADVLYKKLMRPLLTGDPEAVKETASILDAYGLRKEHLQEHLTELRGHLGSDDLFKLVDPKVKSAMTREFNNGSHMSKVNLGTKGKRKNLTATEDFNPDDPDADPDAVPDDAAKPEGESDDDLAASGLIKKAKAKAKGKAKAKADSSSPQPKAKARGRAKAK